MTDNKRFKVEETIYHDFIDNITGKGYCYGEAIDMLNELTDENEQLKSDNKELQGKYDKQLWVYNGLGCEYDDLKAENEQLQQRNKRQAKHLAELYELMAKKDWNSLTEIIDDLCSCEVDLEAEWKCYE